MKRVKTSYLLLFVATGVILFADASRRSEGSSSKVATEKNKKLELLELQLSLEEKGTALDQRREEIARWKHDNRRFFEKLEVERSANREKELEILASVGPPLQIPVLEGSDPESFVESGHDYLEELAK